MSDIGIAGGSFLVTGGVSLVGSHIAEALLADGAQRIVLFDNLTFGPAPFLESLLVDDRVELVRGDILRVDQLLEAMHGIDGVFAMAGLLALPLSRDPLLGLRVNIEGLVNTLDACRFGGGKKVVFASSLAVYGDQIEDVVGEDTPWGGKSLRPPFAMYGLSKRLGEHIGRHYATTHGVEYAGVRFSTVYGERQHSRGINTLAIADTYRSVLAGVPPVLVGGGRDAHDYVHASDAAAGSIQAMAAGRSGEAYNIASGVSTNTGTLVRLVIEAMGSSLQPVEKPDDRPYGGTMHEQLTIDISKARNELAWQPRVPLREGIERLVEWFAEHEAPLAGTA